MNYKDCYILWSWDGTLVDTTPRHVSLASQIISKNFGVTPQFAMKKYLELLGIPFGVQIQRLFPGADQVVIDRSVMEYDARKMKEIYEEMIDFPDIFATIEGVHEAFPGINQVISSLAEEDLIGEWVTTRGLLPFFSDICGRESGTKVDHISMISQLNRQARICLVSSFVRDMCLPAKCLGVDVSQIRTRSFMRSKAFSFTEDKVNLDWITAMIDIL
ncbi:MAG: hypothetical protein PHW52_02330 [Candidatus Pacebacteria bacterium]|nr:hypothetical protein [Candidatus Paceibacterota bacterium]